MKSRYPFYFLLTLLLSLGVLAASIAPCCASKATASLGEVEEDSVEECMEDLPEEHPDGTCDLTGFEGYEVLDEHCAACLSQAAHAFTVSASHRSLGWLMPLRI